MRKISLFLIIVVLAGFSNTKVQSFDMSPATQGRLDAFTKKGKPLGYSPLKHTKVNADISGFLARVTVEQEFINNFDQPIEAVYTFPLSQNSAVDDMTMKIGSRTIRGKIKKREEARKLYEKAKSEGKTVSLLDQERPNVFTQSVANILPNEKIVIEISYVEHLKYEDGSYEFVFPMVVGPRYSPASMDKKDAAKVTPSVVKTRAGHDISIDVNLDAGVPIENVSSKLHEINTQNLSSNSAKISLRSESAIPNKDFILKYDVTGKQIQDAILTHRDERGGFFTMMLSPPEDFRVEDISPKEIVFVLDTSGSMSGFPIEKAKEAMKMSLEGLYPNDKFNLISFAGSTNILFDEPVYATQSNMEAARNFLDSRSGGGGTEMMKAIKAALEPSDSKEHIRIVNFMTDGYVSNDSQIIAEIQKHPNARVFSFGIGNSVNRYLLDKMSEEGRGEVEYVSLQDDGSAAAKRFHERIRNPLLTDISIDWNGLPVADVYPKRNPDLFDAKPVAIYGRYTKGASGTINLKGKIGGQTFMRPIHVNFPDAQEQNDVLATLWARTLISDLMSQMRLAKGEKVRKEIIQTITNLGLEFRLLTQYTSFVAVEEVIRTDGGKPVKVEVPVELSEGSFNDGVDRETGSLSGLTATPVLKKLFQKKQTANSKVAPTIGNGSGGGSGSGVTTDGYVAGGRSDASNIILDGVNLKNSSSGGVISTILKRMKSHYDALRTLKANIVMTKHDSTRGVNETNQGILNYLVQKGKKPYFRIDWIQPVQETLVVKNGSYLLYRPQLKQALTAKIGDKNFGELFVLLGMARREIANKYTIQKLSNKKMGNDELWHLRLKPKKETGCKSIEIWVDGNGMIVQTMAKESNGDWTSVRVSNVSKNKAITPFTFNLKLPIGTKIIK